MKRRTQVCLLSEEFSVVDESAQPGGELGGVGRHLLYAGNDETQRQYHQLRVLLVVER